MSEKNAAATKRAKMVEALRAERVTYATAGMLDRVKQIDASIEALGGKAPADRRAPRRETA